MQGLRDADAVEYLNTDRRTDVFEREDDSRVKDPSNGNWFERFRARPQV